MNVEQIFRDHGALLEGHFLLSSGLHSPRYLQCALVLAQPRRAEEFGAALAARVAVKPDLVVSPAMGGLIIGQEVARALGVRHYFAERTDGAMSLRRGFAVAPREKVLVVEDVITTGKSTREVFAVLRAAGADVVGAASIVDRTEGRAAFEVPFTALWAVSIPTRRSEECPQCREGIPAVKPGSRQEPRHA